MPHFVEMAAPENATKATFAAPTENATEATLAAPAITVIIISFWLLLASVNTYEPASVKVKTNIDVPGPASVCRASQGLFIL